MDKYKSGYNAITELKGRNSDMQMDFGIISLSDGILYENQEPMERTFLLIHGAVTLYWNGLEKKINRKSSFNEKPWCLHVPKDVMVIIKGHRESELTYQAVENDKVFHCKLYTQDDCVSEIFGQGTLGEASTRTVRTVIDDTIAPYSNLVIGEVINHPGRWSSYPPHHHVQPEVYHYRFFPEQGFGYSEEGDQVYKVTNKDSAMIRRDQTHSQVAAPGYAMYYVWMIPHIKEKRWEKDRTYLEKDLWLLEKDAKIWPERHEVE
jgi:5-deoxy-glucuronate isomerase